LIVLALAVGCYAQTTEITGTLTKSDGSKLSGTFSISWPGYTRNGARIQADMMEVYINNGVVDVRLPPSSGASIPVVYTITAPGLIDFWYVPGSSIAVDIDTVRNINAARQSAAGDVTINRGIVWNPITVLPPVTSLPANTVVYYTHDSAPNKCGGTPGTAKSFCFNTGADWLSLPLSDGDGGVVVPACTIAASPTVSPGALCRFTDAATITDCITGLGSAMSVCMWNGSTWQKQ
jgi:hypothetical protein